MAAFNSTFQTDLAKPSRVVPIPDTYTRGDNESHTITVLVYDSANPSCGLMAGSVSAAVARQDGNTIPLTTGTKGAATVPVKLADGSTAQATPCTVTLKQACFDCPGQVVVVIRLVSGETITSIFVGSGKVNEGLTNSIIDPGDVITDITALIAAAEQAAEDAEEALAIATHMVRYDETQTMTSSERAIASHNVGAHKIAEVFDPTATYTQGRYVLYLGDLYRLDAASFGPGAFNYSTGGWTYINPTQEPISLAEHAYTDAEKAQARENIGAGSAEDVSDLQMTDLQLGGAISDVGHSLAADYNWQTGTYAVGDYVMYGDKLYRCATAIATPETWTPAHWTEVKLTGEVTDLKGAIKASEYVEECPFIKELYINNTGKTAGVSKLHSVYVGSQYGYFLRFSNGTTFTGHTEATTTPYFGVLTIYSGQTGTAAVYGYVIVNWDAVTAAYSPVKSLTEAAYNIAFSPQISAETETNKKVATLEQKTAYENYEQVDLQFALISTDYNLNDVTDTNNRFITSKPFVCKGKMRIEIDAAFVNEGFKLYIMSTQSGKLNQWGTNIDITTSQVDVEYNDTVRVAIFQANGISAYFNKIVSTTRIYTLKSGVYYDYMRNKIISGRKIWCFGDSLTAGVITGSTTITESYPYWLKKFLDNDNAEISNFGVPGDTAVNMYSVISGKTFYGNCDIALIMIGTNGYMNGETDDPTTPLGAYYASIEHIINSGKGTVKIVLINPPKSIRSGVPARWLDAMHYKEELIAEHFNLDMIDLYAFLPFEPDNATYYSSDKTHFTAIGYYWIAYIVYQYLTTHMTAQQIGGNPVFDY